MILVNEQIDLNLWNKFANHKIFFRYEWLYIIKKIYNLEPFFVLCDKADKFALIASFKTTKGYISLPFNSYSGFLSNDEEMLNNLKVYLKEQNIEIDSRDLLDEEVTSGYVNPIVEIATFDDFWKNISTNMRNQFKKSEKYDYEFKEEKELKNFYMLYVLGMRNLGTPCHGEKYFQEIIKFFQYKIFVTYKDNLPIGAMFCLLDNETLAVMYAYVLPEYSKEYANYFMYLEAIKWTSQNEYRYFDMGRSTFGEGTFHFKSKFRPKVYKINSKVNYSSNSKLQLISKAWTKLPLYVANILGPQLRKYLP